MDFIVAKAWQYAIPSKGKRCTIHMLVRVKLFHILYPSYVCAYPIQYSVSLNITCSLCGFLTFIIHHRQFLCKNCTDT